MGDGGVACMSLQHSNNVMERFPIQEKTTTVAAAATATTSATTKNNENSGNNKNSSFSDNNSITGNNGNGTSNGSKPKPKRVVKKIIKVKRVVPVKKSVVAGAEKKQVGPPKEVKSGTEVDKKEEKSVKEADRKEVKSGSKEEAEKKEAKSGIKEVNKKDTKSASNEVQKSELGPISSDNSLVQNSTDNDKEEVEEGELGTLKWPTKAEAENGEFHLPENSRRSDIQKGEIVDEKWSKGDIEKGEIVPGNKWRKGDSAREEIEKGEFIPDRWHSKDEHFYNKSRGRYDSVADRTPPSGKYSSEDVHRRKEFYGSGSSQHNKSSSRWECGQDRNVRLSSKIVDEEGLYKCEYSNGKNHGRDYASVNRQKRYGSDFEGGERKYYGDCGDYAGSKSRRLSEDSSRSVLSEHYSRHSVERFHRNSSSSRLSSLDKYNSRHHEPTSSSKVFYDRHGRSPGNTEQSPRDRPRGHDPRDRTPARRERSPFVRERSPYVLESSPYGRDRSPYGRERSPYGREKSPYGRERSPYDHRSRHYDHRNRSPYLERSPLDRSRYHDRRDRTPNFRERSPLDRSKPNNKESSRKGGANEKRNHQSGNKGLDDKLIRRDSNVKDTVPVAKESQNMSSVQNLNAVDEKKAVSESHKEEQPLNPTAIHVESPQADEHPAEELLSMEEDMDISDTPPHVPIVADSSTGKWFYLDHFGVERGPSRLCDLRALVDEGVLVSDHFVKHLDSDRWLTIENAVSPLVTMTFPSIVSDTITQLVSPPEAPGNLLADTGDAGHSCILTDEEPSVTLLHPSGFSDHNTAAARPLEDSHIDERVDSLMDGVTIVPGKELETIGGVLQMALKDAQSEEWQTTEGSMWNQVFGTEDYDQIVYELSGLSYWKTDEASQGTSSGLSDKDTVASSVDCADCFSGRWSCKGGDWKRNEDAIQDRVYRKKLVLNDGFPLCLMPKSGSEDPRWNKKDDLYYPSQSRRLDLPPWAFSCSDDKNEGNGSGRPSLTKSPVVRGAKGTMLSVVRINACVVKDHGSIVSETRPKVRGKDRIPSRSARAYSTSNEVKRSYVEGDHQLKTIDSHGSYKSTATINTPKDRLCTVDDLQLHVGEWYYLDGAGHECGPLSFSELQTLADQGAIKKGSSIFRKFDGLWVPVASAVVHSEEIDKSQAANAALSVNSIGSAPQKEICSNSSSFHSLHPQFVGYTRGKLHELVMKSYKSREFAAAINEVLDPWINAKQPKKDSDKHMYWKSEIEARAGKRVRMQVDESDADLEVEEDVQTLQKDDTTFEELCGNATFPQEERTLYEAEMGSWGLLDGHVLARIFHCLRSDFKSLVLASLACKHWRAAVNFYRDVTEQVDLSSMGPKCTDSMIRNIMNGYSKEKIKSMVLFGCTNVTSGMLEEIICSLPCLSSVDIRGCSQFMQLALQFPNLSWLKNRMRTWEESSSRIRSLKQINDKTKCPGNDADDFGELKEYFDSVNKRDSAHQLFRRSLYKRSKLFDARRSSSIVSRDARMRRWAIKKSGNGYKRMEGFLSLALKDIMKENTFDFFVPKVAEIENRMKNGYYIGHGLRSVKEDISRMCRDAIKAKNRGAGDMNCIITLFLQLASRLEESSKFAYERDELVKSWKDDLVAVLGSAPMKYKKKLLSERKNLHRSNGTTSANGSFDFGAYASDREIRKRLSKLNRKSLDSGGETSDDGDRFSEDGRSDPDITASDTESDLDFHFEGRINESRGDGCYLEDESLDSMVDEREWGARMTKASLVPPVTRKYEVIDHYVIVADEEDVQRKMSVSLPDDYAEKLDAQRNGSEELDMELPEVKDYKPRKQLGDEVLEQEVYGIDPYTHNLLLDSMPEEVDCSQLEKHLFIEDVFLRALNKQVRHYTGTGNTPMMYHLHPVIEKIEQDAVDDCDIRTVKICQGILKAMDSRPDDNYVAYRKGLGVVCNKEEGFGVEDFVVEFLGEVYPAWKWFEKQDGIRSLQKDSKDPAPEFYNIYLERPKGDADGYDLVVVDAMHKANYASRICHSCKPNCEAKVTAVDGQYQIGIYTVRGIQYGEEITFDYNSVTESKEEYEASVCLCGNQVCRGSYLNLTGEGAFQKVLKQWHGILNRHHLLLEACQLNSVTEDDYLDLGRAGLGSCLLGGLPDWLVAYSARLVRFINLERTKLPAEILRHNLEEKSKYFSDISIEVERSDAEVQAEGVYNQRLQNLAVSLDKVRYVMRCVFGDPKKAPPPLEKLSPEETVSFLWKGDGSFVEELLQCMGPHMEADVLNDLKSQIRAHDPSDSDDILKVLQESLLWLRDEVRNLPCTYKCRHDAAADLIHVYAYTKNFFRVREYNAFTSPPVVISPLDLGPKFAEKLGEGVHEYRKTYGENYCMGQLIYWHLQTNADPDISLAKASRGCLSLPDIGSFYAKVQKPSQQRIYGLKTVKIMLERMERYPQKPWPKDQIWSFKNPPKVIGSPMLDAVLESSSLDREMMHWLKHRPTVYQAVWDR